MAQAYAIDVAHLRKVFGGQGRKDETLAVADLTLRVERGEVFGFLGPNGAGKTTALKMFLGLVRPTGGEGQILGRALGDPEGRLKVGFLPEHFRFHEWLTAAEFLNNADEAEIARIIRDYGEEPRARRVAGKADGDRRAAQDGAQPPLGTR